MDDVATTGIEIAKNKISCTERSKMKKFQPQGHNIQDWLSDGSNVTQIEKNEITQTLKQGEEYPAFLRGNELICATNEEEGRKLVSEAGPNSDFYAVKRNLVDAGGDTTGGGTQGGGSSGSTNS
jgi:hypothetical protein